MRNIITGLLLLSLTPVAAQADFLCTYKTYYGLEADGLLGLGTEGIDIGKRFTVNTDGETGGEIVGDFEVYDDGKRDGWAFKAMQREAPGERLMRMLNPQEYADKDQVAMLKKERSIPRVLYIQTFEEGNIKPFVLYQGGSLNTGTCEKL